jgi:hypothetical protein
MLFVSFATGFVNSRCLHLTSAIPICFFMHRLWQLAAGESFPRRRIYDGRLALTLRRHGVSDFATTNVKDFEAFGFRRVWNPLEP